MENANKLQNTKDVTWEQTVDLEHLEKKVWISNFQDGMFDIFFALLFFINGIQQLFYNIWFSLLMFVAVAIYILGKQFITRPRLGAVKYGKKRLMKQQKAHYVLLITFLSTLVIMIIAGSGQFNIEMDFSIVIMILFIVIFGSLAFFMDFYRFLLYGVMFAIGEFTIRHYGDEAGGYIMFCFAGILTVIGIYYMVQFLKKNPRASAEVINA